MKYIVTVIIAFCLFGCQSNHVEQAVPSKVVTWGKITNPADSFVVFFKGKNADTAILDENGNFSLTFEIDSSSPYTFFHGQEISSMFLSPGDSIGLKLDTEAFDETIEYTGQGSDANNYLASKTLHRENLVPPFDSLYALDEKDFTHTLDSAHHYLKSHLEEVRNSTSIDKGFWEYEIVNIDYDWALQRLNYPKYHKYVTKKDSFAVGNEYYDFLNQLGLARADQLENRAYKTFVTSYISMKASELREKDSSYLEMSNAYLASVFSAIEANIDNKAVKEYLMYDNLYSTLNQGETDDIERFVQVFKETSSNQEHLGKVNELLTIWSDSLAPGKNAPEFEFTDLAGKAYALSDFKDKYIYIDVWATWCVPCKREYPFFEELTRDFEGKNIVFLGISTDKDFEAWQKMVKKDEMMGIQLHAGGKSKSSFKEDYHIQFIPRFILIDKEGKIIDAQAERPSGKIREQLEQLEGIES